MKNSGDNVFGGIPVAKDEASHFGQYLASQDFSANTRRAVTQDVRKFARWFTEANKEPFRVSRVTTRDVTGFRDDLRRNQKPGRRHSQPCPGDGAPLSGMAG